VVICEKCQDRGFIEHEHGLLVEICDCEAGKTYEVKKRELLGFFEEKDDNGDDLEHPNDSGTEPSNTDIGKLNPSEPEQPKKPRKKKKARKRVK